MVENEDNQDQLATLIDELKAFQEKQIETQEKQLLINAWNTFLSATILAKHDILGANKTLPSGLENGVKVIVDGQEVFLPPPTLNDPRSENKVCPCGYFPTRCAHLMKFNLDVSFCPFVSQFHSNPNLDCFCPFTSAKSEFITITKNCLTDETKIESGKICDSLPIPRDGFMDGAHLRIKAGNIEYINKAGASTIIYPNNNLNECCENTKTCGVKIYKKGNSLKITNKSTCELGPYEILHISTSGESGLLKTILQKANISEHFDITEISLADFNNSASPSDDLTQFQCLFFGIVDIEAASTAITRISDIVEYVNKGNSVYFSHVWFDYGHYYKDLYSLFGLQDNYSQYGAENAKLSYAGHHLTTSHVFNNIYFCLGQKGAMVTLPSAHTTGAMLVDAIPLIRGNKCVYNDNSPVFTRFESSETEIEYFEENSKLLIPFNFAGILEAYKQGDTLVNVIDYEGIENYKGSKLHFLVFLGYADNISNGANVGSIQVYYKSGEANVAGPGVELIAGQNIAEWAQNRPELEGCLQHDKVDAAYKWPSNVDSNYWYDANAFYVSIELDSRKRIDLIRLTLNSEAYTDQTPPGGDCVGYESEEDTVTVKIVGITLQTQSEENPIIEADANSLYNFDLSLKEYQCIPLIDSQYETLSTLEVLYITVWDSGELSNILSSLGIDEKFNITVKTISEFNNDDPTDLTLFDVIILPISNCGFLANDNSDLQRIDELLLAHSEGVGIIAPVDTLQGKGFWFDQLRSYANLEFDEDSETEKEVKGKISFKDHGILKTLYCFNKNLKINIDNTHTTQGLKLLPESQIVAKSTSENESWRSKGLGDPDNFYMVAQESRAMPDVNSDSISSPVNILHVTEHHEGELDSLFESLGMDSKFTVTEVPIAQWQLGDFPVEENECSSISVISTSEIRLMGINKAPTYNIDGKAIKINDNGTIRYGTVTAASLPTASNYTTETNTITWIANNTVKINTDVTANYPTGRLIRVKRIEDDGAIEDAYDIVKSSYWDGAYTWVTSRYNHFGDSADAFKQLEYGDSQGYTKLELSGFTTLNTVTNLYHKSDDPADPVLSYPSDEQNLADYDVIIFGFKDVFDLNSDGTFTHVLRTSELATWLDEDSTNRGLLFGHTAYEFGTDWGSNLETLMGVKNEQAGIEQYTSDWFGCSGQKIKIQKEHNVLKSFYHLGCLDDVIKVQPSHTTQGKVIDADIIFRFTEDQTVDAAYNHYLTVKENTNGRAALVQIGHYHDDKAKLSELNIEERKILVNAIAWLAHYDGSDAPECISKRFVATMFGGAAFPCEGSSPNFNRPASEECKLFANALCYVAGIDPAEDQGECNSIARCVYHPGLGHYFGWQDENGSVSCQDIFNDNTPAGVQCANLNLAKVVTNMLFYLCKKSLPCEEDEKEEFALINLNKIDCAGKDVAEAEIIIPPQSPTPTPIPIPPDYPVVFYAKPIPIKEKYYPDKTVIKYNNENAFIFFADGRVAIVFSNGSVQKLGDINIQVKKQGDTVTIIFPNGNSFNWDVTKQTQEKERKLNTFKCSDE